MLYNYLGRSFPLKLIANFKINRNNYKNKKKIKKTANIWSVLACFKILESRYFSRALKSVKLSKTTYSLPLDDGNFPWIDDGLFPLDFTFLLDPGDGVFNCFNTREGLVPLEDGGVRYKVVGRITIMTN